MKKLDKYKQKIFCYNFKYAKIEYQKGANYKKAL